MDVLPGQNEPGDAGGLPGADQDLRDYLSFRLGPREAFPLADTSLNAQS